MTEPGKKMYASLAAQVIIARAERAGHSVEYVPFHGLCRRDDIDVWLVSLHHVRDYLRLPAMFRKLGFEPLASERHERPLFVAGGGPLTNPLPVAAFFDALCIGEGEEWIQEALRALAQRRSVDALAGIEGTYLPIWGRSRVVRRRMFRDIASNGGFVNFPAEGYPKGIKDVLYLEAARGCLYKCRFCKLGWTRPVFDEWSFPEVERELATQALMHPNVRYISLNAPDAGSMSWYPDMPDLLERYGYNMPYASIRFDSFKILERLKRNQLVRLGLEGMSHRLRRWLNKGDWDSKYIVDVMRRVYCAQGLPTAKWFVITSLPGEREEDYEEFKDLCARLMNVPPHWGILRISATNFIPEPHTPMQWFPARYSVKSNQAVEDGRMAVRSVMRRLRTFGIRPIERATGETRYLLEVALTRGDESFARFIIAADDRKAELARLRGDELLAAYVEVAGDVGCNLLAATDEFAADTPLPWDFVDAGLPKALLQEFYRRMREEMSR